MPSVAERHAWHSFRETMARRQAEFDGQVPVALLIGSLCHRHDHSTKDEGDVDVDMDGAFAILRPPGMTVEQVATLFEDIARGVRGGTIR